MLANGTGQLVRAGARRVDDVAVVHRQAATSSRRLVASRCSRSCSSACGQVIFAESSSHSARAVSGTPSTRASCPLLQPSLRRRERKEGSLMVCTRCKCAARCAPSRHGRGRLAPAAASGRAARWRGWSLPGSAHRMACERCSRHPEPRSMPEERQRRRDGEGSPAQMRDAPGRGGSFAVPSLRSGQALRRFAAPAAQDDT